MGLGEKTASHSLMQVKLEFKRRHFSSSKKNGTAMAVPAVPLPPALQDQLSRDLQNSYWLLVCRNVEELMTSMIMVHMYIPLCINQGQHSKHHLMNT